VSEPAERDARNPRRRRLLVGLVACVVLGFLVLTAVTQWHELRDADVRFAPGWFAVGLVGLLAYQVAQGEVSRPVLRALGSSIAAPRMRTIVGAGLLARYVPTGALTVVVRVAMEGREGVPQRTAVVGLLYEFAFAVSAAGIVSGLLLFRIGAEWGLLWLVASPIAVAILLHPRVFVAAVNGILARFGRPTVTRPVGLRAGLGLTALCVVSFVLYGLGVLCVVAGITTIPDGAVAVIVASAGVGFIASMVGFALPGGLGAREAGLALALGLVLPGPLALAVTLICRLLQIAAEVLYASATSLYDRGRRAASGASA
jgi:uncharacterized membrane protein YbhN (UPF0104 family)